MNRQETITLAENAKKIINNPAWHLITNTMMDALQQNWADCKDPVVREDIWHSQNSLAELIAEFESVIMNGEIAVDNDA